MTVRQARLGGNGWDDQPRVSDPTLRELFEDPLVRMLMASDGVDPRWLWNFLADIASRQMRGHETRLCIE
jgi:hypothetical protein